MTQSDARRCCPPGSGNWRRSCRAEGGSVAGLADLLGDLHEESLDVERMVAGLDDAGWQQKTPSPGWTVAHQIAHLRWTDRAATLAAAEPSRFADLIAAAAGDLPGLVEQSAQECLTPPNELLAGWRNNRT